MLKTSEKIFPMSKICDDIQTRFLQFEDQEKTTKKITKN